MLNDTTAFKKIYIATGYTDLRQGIDGLASYVKMQFQLDPFDKDTLFLFCGRKATKIKGLVWEGLSADFCYPHILYQDPYKTVTSGMNRKKICG